MFNWFKETKKNTPFTLELLTSDAGFWSIRKTYSSGYCEYLDLRIYFNPVHVPWPFEYGELGLRWDSRFIDSSVLRGYILTTIPISPSQTFAKIVKLHQDNSKLDRKLNVVESVVCK